mgnify:CR=1 FL=1
MKTTRTMTPLGMRSILDFRYRGVRYRPVLGYNLTTDQEHEAMVQMLTAIQSQIRPDATTTGLTFAQFVPKYLDRLNGKALAALDRPKTILTRHLVPFFGIRPLHSLKLEDGVAYIAHRRGEMAADGTIRRECGVLLGLLNYAVANEDLDKNRLLSLDLPIGAQRTRVAKPSELYWIYHLSSPAVQRMMMLALLTGLREAKIIAIDQEWIIERTDGEWLIPVQGSRLKRVPDELPLSPLASSFLCGTLPRIGGRFFSQWRDAGSFKHRWAKACARASVQDLHFHDLRHTAATWLCEAGVEYATTEKLLGHRLPGMGEQYMHNWKPKLRAAVTTLEAIAIERFREASHEAGAGGWPRNGIQNCTHTRSTLAGWWESMPVSRSAISNGSLHTSQLKGVSI